MLQHNEIEQNFEQNQVEQNKDNLYLYIYIYFYIIYEGLCIEEQAYEHMTFDIYLANLARNSIFQTKCQSYFLN